MAKGFARKLVVVAAISISAFVIAGLVSNFVNVECKHSEQVNVPGVAATCTETGLTIGKKCKACDEVIVAQKEIPATGKHIDSNVDYVCDDCGVGMSPANFTEVPLEDPYAKVAGKWLRVYRPSAVSEGLNLNGARNVCLCNISDDMDEVNLYITDSGMFEDSDLGDGKEIKIEGMIVVETESYVDFYFKVGEYTVKYADGNEWIYDFMITEGSELYLSNCNGFFWLEDPNPAE